MYLLDLSKVVLRVFVQDELPNGTKREFAVGPDFGKIEDVVPEFLSLLGCHRLLQKGTKHQKQVCIEKMLIFSQCRQSR